MADTPAPDVIEPGAIEPGAIEQVTLRDGGMSVTLLSLGCITQDWQVRFRGWDVPVVLGYRDPEAYRHNPGYLGAIVGRVANRIAGAAFTLEGQHYTLPANDGPHHLHGGPQGLHTRLWQVEREGANRVRFRYHSPDGEAGYPGAVDFTVTVTLDAPRLTYDMRAVPDRATPIALAQHNYYALGAGEVHDQSLMIRASGWTPAGADLIPEARIAPPDGSAVDFRTPRTLAQADPERRGMDHNYALADGPGPVARLSAPGGLAMEMHSDQPGLQLYTAAHLAPLATPLPGQTHGPFRGLCLEPQGFPNAVNTPGFPSVIATPDAPYRQVLTVSIFDADHA